MVCFNFLENPSFKVFSDAVEPDFDIEKTEWKLAAENHEVKLGKYRNKKKWEIACMEDEVDDEANCVLGDTKNLEEEKQFYLYHKKKLDSYSVQQIEVGNMREAHTEKDLRSTFKRI